MNILYIGPYRQLDGWGDYSYNVAKALCKCKDINLTLRPLFMAHGMNQTLFPHKLSDPEILMTENKLHDSYDVVIQHCLPSMFVYNGSFKKNIGLYQYDTKNCDAFDLYTNLMDEVWIPTEYENKDYKSIGISMVETDSSFTPFDKFRFYAVANGVGPQSGLPQLLLAFLNTFTVNDKVVLDLYSQEQNVENVKRLIQESISLVNKYKSQNLYPTIRIKVYQDINSIHTGGDCFINPSLVNSVDYLTLTALKFNRTPMVVQGTLMESMLPQESIWSIKSYENSIVETGRPLYDIFSLNERWNPIIIFELENLLKQAIEEYTTKKQNMNFEKFTTESQTERISKILCSH